MRSPSILVGLVLSAVTLALAGCEGGGGPIVDKPQIATCESSEQCSAGLICSGGKCEIGTCDPLLETQCDVDGLESQYCCKPWELCSPLSFQCANDPSVRGIGCAPDDERCTPCEEPEDCAGGQFCSGAACLEAQGRSQCTSSFQCPGNERCDRTVFLCVPDRGGCTFCGPEFPELCCEEGQVCSEQTGFCQDIPEPECAEDTDCIAGLFCDALSRCVQCDGDDDCGPGTLCDEGDGECFSDSSCETDEDCNGNARCAPGNNICTVPQCDSDSGCRQGSDHRRVCNHELFACELPPAVCEEDDEDNDTTSTAIEMTASGEFDASYSGLLCRDDTDVLSFPVRPNKRYSAIINFSAAGQAGIIATMLDSSFQVESSTVMSATQTSMEVVGVSGNAETGRFYVRVQGNNTQNDQWSFSVIVTEDEPSQPADCSEAGQLEEPNNDFATATPVVLSQTTIFSRCGTTDVDFYRVTLPPLHGVEVLVNNFFNAEGNLNVELFSAPDVGSRVVAAATTNNVEIAAGPEGVVEYFVKVSLASASGALVNQAYSLTPTLVPRGPECAADVNEPDNTLQTAHELPLIVAEPGAMPSATFGVSETLQRCNASDVDLFRFAIPPSVAGVVRLRFSHNEGDMALDLLDGTTGAVISTSNVSNAASDPDEQVDVPGSATETIEYVARARLNGSTGGTTAQRYSIEVLTFDNSQCLASEPNGGDDSFARGRCIGGYTEDPDFPCLNNGARIAEPMLEADLAACLSAPIGTIDGCGLICGSGDSDWYRVGPMHNDAVLRASLDYNIADGPLSLVRGVLNSATNVVTETTISDVDNDGHVEFAFATPRTGGAKEYGVRVRARGTVGHQQQPYALAIEQGPECIDDVNDVGALVNERPQNATVIRPNPQVGPFTFSSSSLSRCTNDVDVYELISFAREEVRVTLTQQDTSPSGLIAVIGTRPANLAEPAVLDPPVIATAGGGTVLFTNPQTQQLYVTVTVPTGTVVTGAYTLTIATTP